MGIGIAIILDIFIQIGPLVAGLGLSVAVALGAQDFLKIISGILIIGEHRFQPGDRIE